MAIIKTKKRKSKKTNYNFSSEYANQKMLFEWAKVIENKYPELKLLNASLNGVRLSIGQAMKAKRAGMKKGYPDIFLPVARGKYHGLFIELKIKGGYPTKEQKWWIDKLNKEGYKACVCYGFEEAKNVILNYLNKIGG